MTMNKLTEKISFRLSYEEKLKFFNNAKSSLISGKVIRCMIDKFNNDIDFQNDILFQVESLKIKNIKEPKHRDLESFREYNRKRQNRYRKLNTLNKLKSNIRNRVLIGLKAKNVSKNKTTQDYLGCSFEFYKKYLEGRFIKRMSWKNHGEWHIDHIIPLASANTEEELIKLFHYTNTQPLWAKDNLSKGARYDTTTQN